jgi:enoyl-CoA hydratase/carnithine racemase
MQSHEVLFETLSGQYGEVGVITLNRPDSLNALNFNMCVAIDQQLRVWEQAPNIKAVVIRGAGERAFCAGGDVRQIYEAGPQGWERSREFFHHEYNLDRRIHHYPKPYIALLDGITMGGGMGLSMHGSHRVATEKLKLAMPETGIGFFPDIGGSYFLTRCVGKMGWYLGLTGAVCNAADGQYVGLINAVIASHQLSELLASLVAADWTQGAHQAATAVIATYAAQSEGSSVAGLAAHRETIDRCFSQPTVEAILEQLAQQTDDWSQQTLKTLQQRSPTSLKVTLASLNRAALMNFDEAIQQEYRVAQHFLSNLDFYEGVRAAVIDKDRNPRWQPNNLSAVSAEQVEAYFQREGRNELLCTNPVETRHLV